MQLSDVPDIGIVKTRLRSSTNYSLRQKLIGLWYFQESYTFNFCLVIPMLLPSGKNNLTPKSATSSINWYLRLQF
jgi:hypothetical protein